MAEQSIWKRGMIVGLIGAVTVAIWFFVIDVALGRPLFTPAVLGSALLFGVRDLAQVEVGAGTVLGYSVIHLLGFGVLGMIVVGLVTRARSRPNFLLALLLIFVVWQALFFGLLAIAAEFLLGALAWWSVAIGNLLAATTMGFYLWKGDPDLQEAVRSFPFE